MSANFRMTVTYIVGLNKTAAILDLRAHYLGTKDHCDAPTEDLLESGPQEFLSCIGVDLDQEGTYTLTVDGEEQEDDYPLYREPEVIPKDTQGLLEDVNAVYLEYLQTHGEPKDKTSAGGDNKLWVPVSLIKRIHRALSTKG